MNRTRKTKGWCQQVHDAGVVVVAAALGTITARREGRSGLSPCPACGKAQRGKHDRRGPLGMTRDAMGWRCHRCGIKGDAVTLASWLCGERGEVNPRVRDACAQAGLLRPGAERLPSGSPRAAEVGPSYPPSDELAELTRSVFAIDYAPDRAAMAWLASRALDPQFIAAQGVVMKAAKNFGLPSWARCRGVPWTVSGHRLIAPLCDAHGVMRSVHARQIDGAREDMPKGTNPSGYDVRGLVLACPYARQMFQEGGDSVSAKTLVVAEGLPDWLTWLNYNGKRDKRLAVVGIVAGAWTQALADRVPRGTRITLAGHTDDAGQRYIDTVIKTFRHRIAKGHVEMARRSAA